MIHVIILYYIILYYIILYYIILYYIILYYIILYIIVISRGMYRNHYATTVYLLQGEDTVLFYNCKKVGL